MTAANCTVGWLLFKGKNKTSIFFSSPVTNWILFTKKHTLRSLAHFDYCLAVVQRGNFLQKLQNFIEFQKYLYILLLSIDSWYKGIKCAISAKYTIILHLGSYYNCFNFHA